MSRGIKFDLDRDETQFNLAHTTVNGKRFEVVIEPDLAVKFRNGEIDDITEVLKSQEVFSDALKGKRPTKEDLLKAFGTNDTLEILKKIVLTGDLHVTSAFREEKRRQKKQQIIALIHRNAVDPKTRIPHPPKRIENAMKEAKVKIDDRKAAEDQIQDIVKSLQNIIPIRLEARSIKMRVPATFSSQAYGLIKQYAQIKREVWESDRSLSCDIDIPAGLEQEFYNKLNSLTHGQAITEEIK